MIAGAHDDTPISELGLGPYAERALETNNLRTVSDLAKYHKTGALAGLYRVGPKTLAEVEAVLGRLRPAAEEPADQPRDPRLDPRHGDLVERPGGERRCVVSVSHKGVVRYERLTSLRDGGWRPLRGRADQDLDGWRRWAANGVVVSTTKMRGAG